MWPYQRIFPPESPVHLTVCTWCDMANRGKPFAYGRTVQLADGQTATDGCRRTDSDGRFNGTVTGCAGGRTVTGLIISVA